jgi:hypothetical protein
MPGLRLRQSPGGPEIAIIRNNQPLTVLYGYEIVDGLVWIEVEDVEGRIGWIPQIYLLEITLTPTDTPTVTQTGIPTPTLEFTVTRSLTEMLTGPVFTTTIDSGLVSPDQTPIGTLTPSVSATP